MAKTPTTAHLLPCRLRHRNAGFSLVELMVGMAIALFLLLGLVTFMSDSKRSYLNTNARSQLHENFRFFAERLTHDLKHAGYRGCQHDASLVDPDTLTVHPAVIGVDGGGAAPDRIKIAYYLPAETNILGLTDDTLTVTDSSLFAVGDAIAISSCGQGWERSGLMVEAIPDGNTLELSDTPVTVTPQGLHVLRANDHDIDDDTLISQLYFFADGRLWVQRDATEADLLAPNSDTAEALVGVPAAAGDINVEELVENMQFLYGEDTSTIRDGIADVFVSADAVGSWTNVTSVRAAILFASAIDPTLPIDTRTYRLLDVTVDPADERRHRKVLRFEVQLRNQINVF